MPTLTCYDLHPGGAFRFGRRGVGEEETGAFVSADTLFGAVLAALLEFGYDAEALGRLFMRAEGQPEPPEVPFLLTSAFPRAGEVCFYPALPLNHLQIDERTLETRLKELRGIKFFSEAIFKKAIADETLDAWLPDADQAQETDKGLFLQGKALWLTAEEVAGLPKHLRLREVAKGKKWSPRSFQALRSMAVWQIDKAPRVTVDRITNRSSIFHTGRLYFQEGCGFWLGIDWRDSDKPLPGATQPMTIRQGVELAFTAPADTGLGGDRAVGYGHFQFEKAGQITWPNPTAGQPFVTLSRYHPHRAELPGSLQGDPVAYSLASIGGWLRTFGLKAQRRRRLWMIEEGSIVRAVGPGPWGDVIDVRPEYEPPAFEKPEGLEDDVFPHPVWRYGLACPVAFGGNDGI